MKILESEQHIIKTLNTKKERLEKIADSLDPIDPSMYEAHIRRTSHAKAYLKELEDLRAEFFNLGLKIKLVPKPTFEKQVARADFASTDFEGEYCQVAHISNYPFEDLWLIYTAPIESI